MHSRQRPLVEPAGSPRGAVCERFVFAFALWTIAVHVTVLLRGDLFDLLAVGAVLGALGLALAPLLRDGGHRPATATTRPSHRLQTRLFWLLAAAVVGLSLIAHRPDPDDALYLNLAVSAADAPGEPIQQLDRQHSLDRQVQIKRSARLTSLGALAATVSMLTGIPVITLFHLVLPPCAALLVLLANRQLFRILTPEHWAFGVLAAVVFLVADGEAHRSFGNFSFVRLHQGKAVLVSAFVPLLIAYALRFALRPTRRGWLRLAAVQIAALGCSSSALIVAPVVAALALLAGVFHTRAPGRLITLFWGLLGSAYVAGLAAWARLPLLAALLSRGGDAVPDPSVRLTEHVGLVWGDGRLWVLHVFALSTAWIWCRTPLARRLCLVFTIAVGLLFLNPLLAGGIAKYTIPEAVYWRVLWLLPGPVMAALSLLAPQTLRRLDGSRRLRYGAFCLLLAAVPMLSKRTILSPENGVELRAPGLKVPAEYEISRRVAALVDGRPTVLVPETVSPWIPTLHGHPYPLVSRFFYANRSRFGADLDPRLALKRYITGYSYLPMEPQRFRRELERYGIACVVFERSNRWREEIRRALATSGLERTEVLMDHEIWAAPVAGHAP